MEGSTITKFNLSSIPEHFMTSNVCEAALNDCVAQLEATVANQQTVDSVYTPFCDTVKQEMGDQIPHRDIEIKPGRSNKRRKVKNKIKGLVVK